MYCPLFWSMLRVHLFLYFTVTCCCDIVQWVHAGNVLYWLNDLRTSEAVCIHVLVFV